MKVLIAMTNPYPGVSAAANHMARMTRGLQLAGHQTLVVAPRLPGESVPLDAFDQHGTPYTSFPMPIKSRRLPYHAHWCAALRPRLRQKLADILRADHYDAAILHGESWWALDPVRQICQQRAIPVVPYAVEWFPPKLRRIASLGWIDQWLLRHLSYPGCDGLMGISRIWSKLAAACGLPFERVPAFSPCDADQLPQVEHDPHLGFRLLFSGTWVERELPGTIIRGVELAARRGVDVELVAVGKIGQRAEERAALRQLARSAARGRIRLTGWLTEPAMQREIAAADAFVLLRNDDREGRALFPTRLPEYLAAGKPVIVSDAGDFVLYLRHGQNAYVIPPGDCPEALADAIEFLATHPKQARHIGIAGRQVLHESFSQERLGRRLAEFLSTLAGGRPAASSAGPQVDGAVEAYGARKRAPSSAGNPALETIEPSETRARRAPSPAPLAAS